MQAKIKLKSYSHGFEKEVKNVFNKHFNRISIDQNYFLVLFSSKFRRINS